jgi:glucokinase
MKKYAIGIDIGGTNVPAAIIDESGEIIHVINKKTMAEGGPDAVIKRITDSITDLVKYFDDNIKTGKIIGIGIGAPGTLDHKKGQIITSPNLPQWRNIPLVERISKEVNMPVFIDNDANCAAIGEHWIGAANGAENAVLVTLGTGVGGGIIINNKIYRGSHGTAGELGHITIFAKGTKCACGNFGCLEAYASANATAARAKERLKREDMASSLQTKKLSEINAYEIYVHAEQGDRFAQDILKESGSYLGIGIATFANIFDPDVIIIGGGFAGAEKYLIPAAIDEAYKRSFKSVMDNIKITTAKLGNNAGIIGAAKLAFDGD